MINNKKIKIISFLVLFLAIIMFSNISYCADGTLSAKQTTSGEKITVTITSSKALGAFTLKASGLTPVSGESDDGEFGGSSIAGVSMKGTTSLGKFVFEVPEKDIKVTFSVTGVADSEGKDLTISSTTITLKAKEATNGGDKNTNNGATNNNTNNNTNSGTTTAEQPKEKSTNAYLSTLGVTPKEYDFSGFKKTTMNYSVTVPSDVDSLKVLYKTADSNAKVKVTGNSTFEVGSNNKITIKVTAEDGKTTKTYTIKVTKLAEEEEKPGNVIEDEEGVYLTSLELDGIKLSPEFAKDTYSYTATLNEPDITEVKVNATANKEKANIEISGNTNLVAGENTINILVKESEGSLQKVYQIVLTKEEAIVTTSEVVLEDSNLINDIMGNMKKYIIIAVVVVALMILAVIILICLLRKENKRLKDEEASKENNEYDVYKNDEKEFENSETEEIQEETIEYISNETETKSEGIKSKRREKGKHSK